MSTDLDAKIAEDAAQAAQWPEPATERSVICYVAALVPDYKIAQTDELERLDLAEQAAEHFAKGARLLGFECASAFFDTFVEVPKCWHTRPE